MVYFQGRAVKLPGGKYSSPMEAPSGFKGIEIHTLEIWQREIFQGKNPWHLNKNNNFEDVDVSKNGGSIPKWMVKIMENPIKMDDLGGKPTILGNTHVSPIENCDVPLPCVFSGGWTTRNAP